MAKKPASTLGAPAASRGATTKRSPIGPTSTGKPPAMGFDDVSASEVGKGVLRAKGNAGIGASDATALGTKGARGRTATSASAPQFRITAKRSPLQQGPYPGTLAAGPVLPSVMGSRQNFYAAGRYGSMSG